MIILPRQARDKHTRENSESIDCGQANAPLADKIDDPSMWLVHEALDDFRRLGVGDLMMMNRPIKLSTFFSPSRQNYQLSALPPDKTIN
jgi:hypothetical protein